MTEQRDPRPRLRDPPRSGGLEDVRHYGDDDDRAAPGDVAPPCSECGSAEREPESTTCADCAEGADGQ